MNSEPSSAKVAASSDDTREELRLLVWDHQDSLYRLAFRILGRSADAEEARQAVFLKLVERPDLLKPVQSIDSWLRRCVINEAMLILRRQRRKREVELSDSALVAPSCGCAADAIRAEQLGILQEAMEELEPEVRAMLSLRFDEELTIREIGRVLDQPHTTIHSRLNSAIKQLRTILSRKT